MKRTAHTFTGPAAMLALAILIGPILGLFIGCRSTAPSEPAAGLPARISALEQRYGVTIHYRYTGTDFFPERYRGEPYSPRGAQIEEDELSETVELIEEFLSAYPPVVIRRHLEDIYLLRWLEWRGKRAGGTNVGTSIYIANDDYRQGYVLELLHSEFSSRLFHRYPFPEERWKRINDKDFEYYGSGWDMLGQEGLMKGSPELWAEGFVVKYGKSSLINDFNMIVRGLFVDMYGRFDELCRTYPKIRAKRELAVEFYRSINPGFDF
jgi:hypothetical protein